MRDEIAVATIANDVAAATIQLLIELQLDGMPIAGTVQQQPHGHPAPFNGWLQLTETIESIRRSAALEPATTVCQAPTQKESRR